MDYSLMDELRGKGADSWPCLCPIDPRNLLTLLTCWLLFPLRSRFPGSLSSCYLG